MSRRKTDARMVSERLTRAQYACDSRGWTLELTLEGLPYASIIDGEDILARIYTREEWETVGEFLWRVCAKIEELDREVGK